MVESETISVVGAGSVETIVSETDSFSIADDVASVVSVSAGKKSDVVLAVSDVVVAAASLLCNVVSGVVVDDESPVTLSVVEAMEPGSVLVAIGELVASDPAISVTVSNTVSEDNLTIPPFITTLGSITPLATNRSTNCWSAGLKAS